MKLKLMMNDFLRKKTITLAVFSLMTISTTLLAVGIRVFVDLGFSIDGLIVAAKALLFCDEPTGALNSASALEVLEILTELNRAGTTILIATHDVKVAARTDRVIYILDGQIGGELRFEGERGVDFPTREARLHRWLLEKGW